MFNVVLTRTTFTYLRYFVASQLAHTEARYRLVANGCPPDQIELMEQFREAHDEQVVEVLDVSPTLMVSHGVALDRVRASRHDGEYFCLIDPDIKANARFVPEFTALLADHAVVTSGTEVWSDDNVVPDWQVAVPGECFFDRDGFVFGSPHLAIYERAALDGTVGRWNVGLGSTGPDLAGPARARMAEVGRRYFAYDTAKIVNVLLQADGHRLVHRDLRQLVHIGGLAHYLSPGGYRENAAGEREPKWAVHEHMAARHEVTRYTARALRALADGDPPPPVPDGLDGSMRSRLELVRREVTDMVERYGDG